MSSMSVATAPAAQLVRSSAPRTSLWRDATRGFRRHRLALIAFTVLLTLVVAVLVGPYVYRVPINEIDFKAKLKGPSRAHPLGTDDLGQDLLARVLYGGRISLAVGVVAMLISITIGTSIGAAAGQLGGATDHTLMRITDLFLSLPQLPLLLLVVYLFRNALTKWLGPEAGVFILVVAVIGGLRWMPVARLVRPSSCRCASASSWRRHAASARRRCVRWSATSCPTRSARSSSPARSTSRWPSSPNRRCRSSASAFRPTFRRGAESSTTPRTTSTSHRTGRSFRAPRSSSLSS